MKLLFAILLLASWLPAQDTSGDCTVITTYPSSVECKTPSVTTAPYIVKVAPLVPKAATQSDDEWLSEVYYPATVLLYTEDWKGGMHFACTATAFEHDGDKYHFATDAHCTSDDSADKKSVEVERVFFFILREDSRGEKKYLKAKVLAAGLQSKGDDFSVLEVKTKDKYPIVPLGVDPTSRIGEPIVNISGPTGLGLQVFRGTVSMPFIDRSLEDKDDDISWTGDFLVQAYGIAPGSSGSAIVCMKQRAICGFLEGHVHNTNTVASPVSRFKAFYDSERLGLYKYFDAVELTAKGQVEHEQKLDRKPKR